jgi:hypothetical protein
MRQVPAGLVYQDDGVGPWRDIQRYLYPIQVHRIGMQNGRT